MKTIEVGGLPSLGEGKMGIALMCFTVVTIITVAVIIHLVFSKRGYEIAVIGESERTAKYIGINVKWRTILTAFMSGAICGVVGVLLSGLINHTVSTTMDANMGFTGIMVDWLSRFDPSAIAPVAFLITLLNKGIGQVNTEFGFASQATNSVITGLIYFFVISVTFYTRYKVRFRSDIEEKMKKVTTPIANFFKRIFSRKKKEEVK
jgi:simple sugar transport system permease protein